ncbi:MAG: hypothetical protein JO290_02690, partial [Sphingomonadaceae bacterium]|nr:hypothetical protein [Sphingomonadaceae bacterium]
MSDTLSADTVQPRRQWPLWLALLLATVWIGLAVARTLPATGIGLDLGIALMPPLAVALIALSLVRAVRPAPDVVQLESRLAQATGDAVLLHEQLVAIDARLASCAERTSHLAAAAAADGSGLAASAKALTASAG